MSTNLVKPSLTWNLWNNSKSVENLRKLQLQKLFTIIPSSSMDFHGIFLNSNERCLLANTSKLFGPNRLSTHTVACGAKRDNVGEAGPYPRRKFRRDLIFEIQLNLDFGENLRISKTRFRRNLDMGTFPKFFYASQEFLEITICHAINATLSQIKLRKSFP
jgi:hypothetical protein